MGKARIYGKFLTYTPNKRRDLRFIKKNQRNRERATPSPVAGVVFQEPAKDWAPFTTAHVAHENGGTTFLLDEKGTMGK